MPARRHIFYEIVIKKLFFRVEKMMIVYLKVHEFFQILPSVKIAK